MGQLFTATFAAVAVSAAQDLFEIVAPAGSRLVIREIKFGQYSDFADAAAEILSVQIIRGFTTTGTGGAAVTASSLGTVPIPASGSTVTRNNTTLAQDGTGAILDADSFNIQAGWVHRPCPDERIQLAAGQRLVVRITAPADGVTMNGTMIYEEVGIP